MKTEAIRGILFSDSSGIFIPQRFAKEMVRSSVTGVSEDDYTILEAGPDHEQYWDVWSDVLDNARITLNDGSRFKNIEPTVCLMYQDGDIFLVDTRAEWDDATESYVMPE